MLNRLYKILPLLLVLCMVALTAVPARGQVTFGADMVSRYVWRGLDIGDAPSIQPYLKHTAGRLTIGTWGAYPFTAGTAVNEHDLYASYARGALEVGVTEYFFPDGGDYFDFQVEGNHVIEPYISYSGPVSVLLAVNVLNDPDNSVYLELGYTGMFNAVEVSLFAGGTTAGTDWYGTAGAGLLAVGIAARKDIALTRDFALPLSVTHIINPSAGKTYLIVGLGF